jgi:hypothetical protein
LALAGGVLFVFKWEMSSGVVQGLIAGLVAGMMVLYSYYLGQRRSVENRLQQSVPTSLLRCPFVMGILSKQTELHRTVPVEGGMPTVGVAMGDMGKRS